MSRWPPDTDAGVSETTPNPRARRTKQILFVIVALIPALLPAVVLGGCNAAWRGYGRITLGEPLGEGHILLRRGKFKQPTWQWVNTEYIYIPIAYRHTVLSAAVDNDGRVVGKQYIAGAFGHWLVCQSGTWHEVMEVRVPQEAFHDPPPDWVRPKQPGWDRLAAIAEALAPLIEEISEPQNRHTDRQWSQRSLSGREVVRSVSVSIHPRRLAKPVRDAIQTGRTDIGVEPGRDVDVSGLLGADLLAAPDVETRIVVGEDKRPSLKAILRIPSPPCDNVLEYLLLVQSHLSPDVGGPGQDIPMLHSALLFPAMILLSGFNGAIGSKMMVLRGAAAYPACLLGVTREGFDWRYTGPVGGTLRIQNLGNRRIRVESRAHVACDALLLVGLVEMLVARTGLEGHLYRKVIRDLTRALRRDPENVDLLVARAATHELGAIHEQEADDEKGVADYSRALELDPEHGKAYRNRAYVHYRLYRYGKAWADVQKARALGQTVDAELLDALRKASPEPLKKSDRNTSTKPGRER